jgi:transcriptional regulator with XRE-family HTH domain
MINYTVEVCIIDVRLRSLLRDRRRSMGYSQRRLEELTGIPRSRISVYENDKVVMTVDTAVRFALVLKCTLDDLFDYYED